MADRFGFHKPSDPAFPNVEDGCIIDFDTSLLSYQMVPTDGRRKISVLGLDGQDSQVVIEAPHVVRFGARTFSLMSGSGTGPTPSTLDGFVQSLPSGMRMVCDLEPLQPGQTNIVMKGPGGAPLASMRVSVKSEVKVTISACRLVDLEFKNTFDDPKIRACMARAKQTFKSTANIALIDEPHIFPVECDIGLGNPIILGRKITEYDNEDSTVFRHIVRNTPAAAKSAEIIAIFGWDFEIIHDPLVGLNHGRFCFVEFDPVERHRNLTLEHEIGHARSLGHNKVASIMNGDGFNGIERFESDEIEKLNTTGNALKP